MYRALTLPCGNVCASGVLPLSEKTSPLLTHSASSFPASSLSWTVSQQQHKIPSFDSLQPYLISAGYDTKEYAKILPHQTYWNHLREMVTNLPAHQSSRNSTPRLQSRQFKSPPCCLRHQWSLKHSRRFQSKDKFGNHCLVKCRLKKKKTDWGYQLNNKLGSLYIFRNCLRVLWILTPQ